MTAMMRAFVVTGPGEAGVYEVEVPVAGHGEVVVDVQRAGVCGTDVEFFTGHMQYLHDGHAKFPMRLGHEWMGTVSAGRARIESSRARAAAAVIIIARLVPGST